MVVYYFNVFSINKKYFGFLVVVINNISFYLNDQGNFIISRPNIFNKECIQLFTTKENNVKIETMEDNHMEETCEIQISNGILTLNVKKKFFSDVPNYKDLDVEELINKYKIANYLHNNKGPALIIKKDGKVLNKQWFLDGKRLSDKDGEKMEFDAQFADGMEKFLSDEK